MFDHLELIDPLALKWSRASLDKLHPLWQPSLDHLSVSVIQVMVYLRYSLILVRRLRLLVDSAIQ